MAGAHEQAAYQARHVIDGLSVGAITVSALGWLQPILAAVATFLSICWFAYQIYDLRDRRKGRKK